MILDKTLKIEPSTENKHDKACIIINFTCNVTRSYKLALWFIGKSAKLQYFGYIKKIIYPNLNAVGCSHPHIRQIICPLLLSA